MRRHSRQRLLYAVPVLALGVSVLPFSASGAPSESGCENRQLNTIDKFLACVDGADASTHLQAFQSFADANGGTRASGTQGYDDSADYVATLLADAGYEVERQEFEFGAYEEISSSLVVDGADLGAEGRADTMAYSGSGDVTPDNVVGIDLDLGLGNSSTSGCEPSDFDGIDFSGPADLAVIQRGFCAFFDKALNAQDAGAEAVVIFNQGNTEARSVKLEGTLGAGAVGVIDIPVLDTSYDDGLLVLGAAELSLSAETFSEIRETENIIADLAGKRSDNVVMAGAHLDSVSEGPGIQDNGSGSAAILSVALAMGQNKKFVPENTVRFAWWGAEESGLIGSTEYIFNPDFGITDEEYFALAAYVNFDMIASPNYIYGVYDADESTFPAPAGVPIPDGSAALEDLFEAYYTIEGIPYEDTEFSGRSDYQAFINVGIPASGLFTGAEQLKTEEQVGIWGGIAGEQYDQCYHQACDTFDNVSQEALDVNVDAVAYAMYNLASTTEAVNDVAGVEPKGITPSEVDLDGPQGTFLEGGGFSKPGEATS
jgi:Zn-dependent M28 family amino/carboxypeptidase